MPPCKTLSENRRSSWIAGALALTLLAVCGPRVFEAEAHGADTPPADTDEASVESADGTHAVKLGSFRVRVFHTISSRKDTVSFVLYATIAKDDYPAFERLYRHHKNKVRDQVVVATRLVPLEDYDDPELKKFRRRILLRLRRTLPELPIEDVYLSDFALSVDMT